MGMFEGRARIGKAIKDLHTRWLETRSSWDDASCRAFESKYLIPLELDSRQAVNAMDGMAQILMQIKRECE
jgi:hypothetical protein